jgi:hypothetical protein
VYVTFGFASVGQFFVLAYFGNAIESTSNDISTTIYKSDWIERDKEFRTNMIITMAAMRNPMVIKTVKVFDANLPTFLFVSFYRR